MVKNGFHKPSCLRVSPPVKNATENRVESPLEPAAQQ